MVVMVVNTHSEQVWAKTMMTKEQIKAARIRACFHSVLMRERDDETGQPETYWRCADCPAVLKLVLEDGKRDAA